MVKTQTTYSAQGKFLITGEYAVLDGVPSLAIPLRLKQYLVVTPTIAQTIHWKSYDADGSLWYEDTFALSLTATVGDSPTTTKLKEILQTALQLSGKNRFDCGYDVSTSLDFNRAYGMGTSSTLIAMVAQWIGCDAYALQFACFGGSGYDIACATAQSAIVYTYDTVQPVVEAARFKPVFSNQLFFIYLNKKQNSRESIARFNKDVLTPDVKLRLSKMPQRFIDATQDLRLFQELMVEHETLISKLVGLEPVQMQFKDFTGKLKSLGGWGGDFILAAGGDAPAYFHARGYDVVLDWDEVVL